VAWVRQVHGGVVLRVDEAGLAGEADALVSDRPGLLLRGRSADCPLVLAAGERLSPATNFRVYLTHPVASRPIFSPMI